MGGSPLFLMPNFSHSSLSTFESCPLHYKLRYVERLEPPDKRESIELFMGKRVHETLAGLYEAPGQALSDVLEGYSGRWDSQWNENVFVVKEGLTPGSYKLRGEHCISSYYSRHAPFTEDATLAIEHRLQIPLGERGAYSLSGVIDRLAKKEDGTYVIHDYKTSSTLPTEAQLKDDRQLTLYQLGVQKKHDDAFRVQLSWHYLNFDKQLVVERSQGEVREVERKTIKLAIDVQGATEEGEFPAKIGSLCKYCEYQPVCPAWNGKEKRHMQTKLLQ